MRSAKVVFCVVLALLAGEQSFVCLGRQLGRARCCALLPPLRLLQRAAASAVARPGSSFVNIEPG